MLELAEQPAWRMKDSGVAAGPVESVALEIPDIKTGDRLVHASFAREQD